MSTPTTRRVYFAEHPTLVTTDIEHGVQVQEVGVSCVRYLQVAVASAIYNVTRGNSGLGLRVTGRCREMMP